MLKAKIRVLIRKAKMLEMLLIYWYS